MFIVVGDVVLAVVMSRWARCNNLILSGPQAAKLHQVDPKVRIMYVAARSGLDRLGCGYSEIQSDSLPTGMSSSRKP